MVAYNEHSGFDERVDRVILESCRIEWLNMQLGLSCWRIVRPRSSCANINSMSEIAFRREYMREESISAAVGLTYQNMVSKENFFNNYPMSRKPDEGRGHVFHGSLSMPIMGGGCWTKMSLHHVHDFRTTDTNVRMGYFHTFLKVT